MIKFFLLILDVIPLFRFYWMFFLVFIVEKLADKIWDVDCARVKNWVVFADISRFLQNANSILANILGDLMANNHLRKIGKTT